MKQIINIQRISIIVIVVCSLILLFSALSLGAYIYQFGKYPLSENQAIWGVFGDYIGGVIGTIFSFAAMIFSLLSIYVSLQIASTIQANEREFQTENLERQIALVHKQNKPYPYFHLLKVSDILSIDLQNFGAGPLIVTSIKIVNANNGEYRNFRDFIATEFPQNEREEKVTITYNSAPSHILVPNGSKSLLKVTPKNQLNIEYKVTQNQLGERLKDWEIKLIYQDIFENEFTFGKKTKFLRKQRPNFYLGILVL